MPNPSDVGEDSLFAISLQYQCPYKWQKMKGGSQTRHCGACKQNVYNISTMTRKEAVDLIKEKEGNLCVRFYQRRDGTVITRDCASILGKERLKPKWNVIAIANAYLAFMATVLMPMLGPALVTIVQGVGPVMKSPSSTDTLSSLHASDLPSTVTETPPANQPSKDLPKNFIAEFLEKFIKTNRDFIARPISP